MRTVIKTKQWHIIVLLIITVLFSVLCWRISAGNMIRAFISEVSSDKAETESVLEKIDSAIDSIGDNWNEFGRKLLLEADSLATYYATGEISCDQVLKGKDRWLFYRSVTDGNPIADYERTNEYSEDEMNHIVKEALATQNEIEKRGAKFQLLIIPNKSNIYTEYMPDYFKHSEISRTDTLVNRLHESGVNVVSPKTELLSSHGDRQLYYSYDTHWNQQGAYIAVKKTLARWDIDIPDLDERMVTSTYLKDGYHYCARDDLAEMSYLRSVFTDDREYVVDGTAKIDWAVFEAEQESNQISKLVNENAPIKAKLMLVGDSFRSAMVPALCEIFEEVYVIHRNFFQPIMLDVEPDYFITEYAERYSNVIAYIYDLIELNR